MNGDRPANFDPMTGKPIIKEKPVFEMTRKDVVFIWIAVALSIVGSALTFWGGFRIGFTVTYVLLFAFLTVYLYRGKTTGYGILCGVLALLSSGVFAVTVNGIVNFFLVLVMFGLSAVWFSSLRSYEDNGSDMGLFTHVFASTFGVSFSGFGISGRSIFKKNEKKTSPAKILIGIACAVPVLVLIIVLLANADEAFGQLLQKIGDYLGDTLWQIFVGALLAPILVSYGLHLKKKERTAKPAREIKGLHNAYVASFLGALCAGYVLYLLAQLAYFFNGFMGILPEGTTYAAYARRGFFELCVIAAINFVVLFLTLLFSRKKNQKPSGGVAAEATFIGGVTLLIIATAMAKMVLYIQTYGLTESRIFCTAFMVFLAVLFVVLMVRFFVSGVPVLRIGLVTATLVLLILGYGNMNKVITEHNLSLYRSGVQKTADPMVMYEEGAAGVPALIEVAKTGSAEDREDADIYLYGILTDYYEVEDYEKEDSPWVLRSKHLGDWNYTESAGKKMLREYYTENKNYKFK